jgi:hypothetical protein
MSGHLLGLNKFPGVQTLGVGEVWRRTSNKTVLLVAKEEAKEVCGINQLCAGLEAGVKGGIHVITELLCLSADKDKAVRDWARIPAAIND